MNSKKILEQRYYSVNNHSAVKICNWTKKSLVDEGNCYKEKFYGIKSHLCCQMSPWITCQNLCLHCWRPIELNMDLGNEIDNPETIIKNSTASQKKLLTGFGGYAKTNKEKYKEAQEPQHFAISLIGEPTLYPKLGEFIKELRKHGKTSFLVTNGLQPTILSKLNKGGNLPTQLYVSLLYPNEKIFRHITNNKEKDSWERFNQTLELLKDQKTKTRTIIRMTLIRDINMQEEYLADYTKLIKKANPLFVEVKGYMAVGGSRKRKGMSYTKMPYHNEIQEFSEKLAKLLKMQILDEKIESRVVLLGKDKSRMKISPQNI